MTVYMIEWIESEGKSVVSNKAIVVSDDEEFAKTVFGGTNYLLKGATVRKLDRGEAAQFVHSRLDDLIPDKEKA